MPDLFQQNIIRRTNELALRANGRTGTNPLVGAVLVNPDNSRILGEGWHREFGGPHAEVNAIADAKKKGDTTNQTIFVSLEPCNHTGKTPPCTTTILDNQLSGVIIDQVDPNPQMGGKSLKLLKEAGLQIQDPADSRTGRTVLHPFMIGQQFRRPFVRLKMAVSRDGFIGQPGGQVKISNAISDRWVHRLRCETQAILAGTGTVLHDNPSLTSRFGNRHHPIRVIPDRRGTLPIDLNVFRGPGEVIVCTLSDRTDYPATILRTDPYELQSMLHRLYQDFNIGSVLIEGGSKIFTSLLEKNCWDELIVIQNTELFLKNGTKSPDFSWQFLQQRIKFGSDTVNFIINPAGR